MSRNVGIVVLLIAVLMLGFDNANLRSQNATLQRQTAKLLETFDAWKDADAKNHETIREYLALVKTCVPQQGGNSR